jgi:2-dehydro-3-deoxygluconokinase
MTPRVASIGECMVELKERPDGALTRSHGGDTLNTAIYLARLGVTVDYVTALGDDPWSDEMAAAWQAEGVGTSLVRRVANRLPGLYVIQTDAGGERRFTYWRDSAAARIVFDLPDAPALVEALAGYDLLYFSGITLSIYGEAGRARLFGGIEAIHDRGGRVAFDTNFRPRGWPDRDIARLLYRDAFAHADFILASTEDLDLLFGADGESELRRHGAAAEIVLKLASPGVMVKLDGVETLVEAPPVAKLADTTAAGDSFAAAYLAARLRGASTVAAAQAGHRLAGLVVQYPGAIIPRSAMNSEITP